ncbi:Hypothetical Protein FCC1311_037872 [Hondaea fermentalgiana]|uniref:Uncharacterized protein n=1 Tax=Hondaea fermentalgiana TaxID=2315210 RepID=A0A2R5GI64_9STRA|nr:Hypothetical Protein FCC1311_037872 [Hondaea fermentalgiana]|eukprot:GBG27564.1 Hypothetical Protein FCC1311_037872 [Hondaea fermentalgiana]
MDEASARAGTEEDDAQHSAAILAETASLLMDNDDGEDDDNDKQQQEQRERQDAPPEPASRVVNVIISAAAAIVNIGLIVDVTDFVVLINDDNKKPIDDAGDVREERADSTLSEERNGAELLAETEALLTGETLQESKASAGHAREAVEQAVRDELCRVHKRLANDVTLVCSGSGVQLRDLFLLDACLFVPLRVDLSNNGALEQIAEALSDHGYELQAPSIGDEPREFVSKAMNFSLGKLQRALQHVDALQLKASSGRPLNEEASVQNRPDAGSVSVEPYASAAVGVEVESKQRGIFICGAEHETEPLLKGLIQRGITRLPSGVASLHADYVRDLEEAWRLGAERKLHALVRPQEKEMLALEFQTAQLVTLIKAEYRAFGVQIPELERPPFISQLPLTYEDDDDGGQEENIGSKGDRGEMHADGSNNTDDERAGAEAEDVALRSSLSRQWSREVSARVARKERQLEMRRDVCARNKTLLIQRLRDSEVARTSRDTLVLCNEMNISPSVVLGHVSCIFERRPGKLSVTYDHILFKSRVLGFKRSLAVPLTDVASYGGAQATGAATIVGAAALVIQVLSTGASIRFLMSSKVDCDRVLALLQQIEVMRRASAAERQRRSSHESKTSDSEAQRTGGELSRRSSGADVRPDLHRRRSADSQASENSHHVGAGNAAGSSGLGTPPTEPSDDSGADLQRMMASTFLNDDEEAF